MKRYNIGTNRGKRRIWVQGEALTAAGFEVGDHYAVTREHDEARLVLRRIGSATDGLHEREDKRPRKVSGKGTMPIIDLIGGIVDDVLPDFNAVLVGASGNGTLVIVGVED